MVLSSKRTFSQCITPDDYENINIKKIKYNNENQEIENFLKLKELLEYSNKNHYIDILKENDLKYAHIYCKKHKLSGQISGPLVENYIITKYNLTKNKSSECTGDCSFNSKNYEIKASLGGNKTHKNFNYVQIRLTHDIHYYILTAYYLSYDNLKEHGMLYIFLLNKDDMKKLLLLYGMYAHGTIKEYGKISSDDLSNINNKKEYALRPVYGDDCWCSLLKYNIDIDTYFYTLTCKKSKKNKKSKKIDS